MLKNRVTLVGACGLFSVDCDVFMGNLFMVYDLIAALFCCYGFSSVRPLNFKVIL